MQAVQLLSVTRELLVRLVGRAEEREAAGGSLQGHTANLVSTTKRE